jgi:phosphoserine phosphatase RsbU/P
LTAHRTAALQGRLADNPKIALAAVVQGAWIAALCSRPEGDSGAKALEHAGAADKPDLILLDVTMPDMDGYEVCTRLKADPETASIPVVFLTARTEAEDEAKGFELGAVDYIHKPFNPTVVRARACTPTCCCAIR